MRVAIQKLQVIEMPVDLCLERVCRISLKYSGPGLIANFVGSLTMPVLELKWPVVHPKMLVYHSSVPNVAITPPHPRWKLFQIRLTLLLSPDEYNCRISLIKLTLEVAYEPPTYLEGCTLYELGRTSFNSELACAWEYSTFHILARSRIPASCW